MPLTLSMTRPSFQVYTKLDLEYPTESNDKNHIHTAEKSKTTGDVGSTISPASAIREVFSKSKSLLRNTTKSCRTYDSHVSLFIYSSLFQKKIYIYIYLLQLFNNEQTLICCVYSTSKQKVESLPTKIRTSSLPNYYCTHDITSRQSYSTASSLCCITLCTFGWGLRDLPQFV